MRRSRRPSACCWNAPAIAWSRPVTDERAWHCLGRGDFDLLFLDIFMPGMDGFETMRMVRQQRPQLPIIVISGRPVASEADQAPDFLTMATKLGAVSSLQKPFRPADLLAAVARLPGSGRARHATAAQRCCFLPVMRHSIRSVRRSPGRSGGRATTDMTLTTRLAIAMIALVAIAVSAVGWLSYRNLEQALLQRARDRIETHSRQVATDLEYYAASATGDVAGFRSAVALQGLVRARKAGGIDPVDGVSEKTWRDRLASRLAAELEAKPTYAMVRFIGFDDDGRELIRVDRAGPNDAVRIVPEEGLQKRSNNLVEMSFRTAPLNSDERAWLDGWTIFYWAWWISWAPFVSMFIARVSKGRTIREFLVGVLIAPTILGTFWFSAFGTTANNIQMSGLQFDQKVSPMTF